MSICGERAVPLAFHFCCFYLSAVLIVSLSRLVFKAGSWSLSFYLLSSIFTNFSSQEIQFSRLISYYFEVQMGGKWYVVTWHPIQNPKKILLRKCTWATSWENMFMPYTSNKGADHPAYPRSLISTFVVRWLDSIIPLVSISKISSLY